MEQYQPEETPLFTEYGARVTDRTFAQERRLRFLNAVVHEMFPAAYNALNRLTVDACTSSSPGEPSNVWLYPRMGFR